MIKETKHRETFMYFTSLGELSKYINETFTGHCIVPLKDLAPKPFVGGYYRIIVQVTCEKFMVEYGDGANPNESFAEDSQKDK